MAPKVYLLVDSDQPMQADPLSRLITQLADQLKCQEVSSCPMPARNCNNPPPQDFQVIRFVDPCKPPPCIPCIPKCENPDKDRVIAEATIDACGQAKAKVSYDKDQACAQPCPPPGCIQICPQPCPPPCIRVMPEPCPPPRIQICQPPCPPPRIQMCPAPRMCPLPCAVPCPLPCAVPCPLTCPQPCPQPPRIQIQEIPNCERRNGLDPTELEMRGQKKFEYLPVTNKIPEYKGSNRCNNKGITLTDHLSSKSVDSRVYGYTRKSALDPKPRCPKHIPEERLIRYNACVTRRDGLQDDCDPLSRRALKSCAKKSTCPLPMRK